MSKFFIESKNDLRVLIRNTSAKMGVSESVIEKDYWVCFVLDYLFSTNMWKEHLTFKGGVDSIIISRRDSTNILGPTLYKII